MKQMGLLPPSYISVEPLNLPLLYSAVSNISDGRGFVQMGSTAAGVSDHQPVEHSMENSNKRYIFDCHTLDRVQKIKPTNKSHNKKTFPLGESSGLEETSCSLARLCTGWPISSEAIFC